MRTNKLQHKQLFRNTTEIQGIEPGFLWYLSLDKKTLIIVDDDQFVSVLYEENKTFFTPVSVL